MAWETCATARGIIPCVSSDSVKCISAGGTEQEEKKDARPRRPSSSSSRCPPRPHARLLLLHLLLRLAQHPSRSPRRTQLSRSRPTARHISSAEARAGFPAGACESVVSASASARTSALSVRMESTLRGEEVRLDMEVLDDAAIWTRAAARRREAGEGVRTAETGGTWRNGGLGGASTGRRRGCRVGIGLEASGGVLLVWMSPPEGITSRLSDFACGMHYADSGGETWVAV
ncbi:hypothetical protein FB451DRAFT_1397012 [Mycena latifolia]|nr:hypothetical protein FB451DRAFT_1397012 [Mycena latifolia]